MDIAEIVEKMIGLSDGNVEDINHFMKVWAYARTIGKKEWVEMRSQYILEAAAVIHDIACPLCREKYGNADGKHQEAESEPLVRAFFAGTDVNAEVIDRIVYLVTHHHSPDAVDGLDYPDRSGLSGQCGRNGSFGREYSEFQRLFFQNENRHRLIEYDLYKSCLKGQLL